MALLPPPFLDCVVAIGFSDANGKTNWCASGFLLGYYLEQLNAQQAKYRIYLITNRHVLADEKIAVLRFNPEKDEPARELTLDLVRPDSSLNWNPHPDPEIDVGVAELDGQLLKSEGIRFDFFHSDTSVVDMKMARQIGVTEGDGIYILGFPMGLVGGERNYVVVRQGIISRIRDCMSGAAKDFLVDATIFPGNSGGPVILKPEGFAVTGTQPINQARLIGVVKSYIPYEDVAISAQTKLPRVIFQENSGLGSIVPIDYVYNCVQVHEEYIKSIQTEEPNPQ